MPLPGSAGRLPLPEPNSTGLAGAGVNITSWIFRIQRNENFTRNKVFSHCLLSLHIGCHGHGVRFSKSALHSPL
ncbi:hypothetical protein FKM82_023921 [Ascaphus truei]